MYEILSGNEDDLRELMDFFDNVRWGLLLRDDYGE